MKRFYACLLVIGLNFGANKLFAQIGINDGAVKSLFEDTTVTMPEVYVFDTAVQMKLTTDPAGPEPLSEMVYTMRYKTEASYIGLFPETIDRVAPPLESMVLVDFESNQMTTFMPASQQRMAMTYQLPEQKINDESLSNLKDTGFEPTGNEKVIAGYTCTEYKINSPNVKGEVWISPDVNINFEKSFQALGLKFEIGDKGLSAPKGFIMQFHTTQIKTGVISKMEVLSVSLKSPYTLATTGYTFTSMPLITEEQE